MTPKFFLADYSTDRVQWRIPAAGLYLYSAAANNQLEEWVIGADGGGRQPRRGVIDCPANMRRVQFSSPSENFIGISHWLAVPTAAGDPEMYVAFQPRAPGSGAPQDIWENVLTEKETGAFLLNKGVTLALTQVSEQRRNASYITVLRNAPNSPALGPLSQNAEIFWNALAGVSDGLIKHMNSSLNAGNLLLPKFRYPEWVFQLNRTLAEGFLEGHASLGLTTHDPDYEIDTTGTTSWGAAIDRTIRSWDIDTFLTDASVTAEERQAMLKLADALMNSVPALVLPLGSDQRRFLDLLLSLTPGKTPSQTFAFWHLHYAHWHKDLAWALRRYGYPAKLSDQQEWNIIAQIIMKNIPSEGQGITVTDWLLARAVQLLSVIGVFPRFLTALVESVLSDIEIAVAASTPP